MLTDRVDSRKDIAMSNKNKSAIALYAQNFLELSEKNKGIVDSYVQSNSFSKFVDMFERNLEKEFCKFKALQVNSNERQVTNIEKNDKLEPTKFEFDTLSPVAMTLENAQPKKNNESPITLSMENQRMKIPSQSASVPNLSVGDSESSPVLHDLPLAPIENMVGSALIDSVSGITQTPKPPSMNTEQHDIVFTVTNAKADEHYRSKLSTDKPQFQNYQILDIVIPPQLGLHYDDIKEELSGIPTSQGDFEIKITYRFMSESINRFCSLKFVVAPNPKSMWKNIPSDRLAPYWKPDEDSRFIRGQDFSLVAASKRGRSHAHTGIFRDDDFRIEYLNDSDWSIAIVSDGAGSCTYSRRGSQIICETSLNHIKKTLSEGKSETIELAAENFYRARAEKIDSTRIEKLRVDLRNELYMVVSHAAYHSVAKIKEEVKVVESRDGKFKDFSSTALISICKKFKFGTLCAAYWVGDGAIGIYSKTTGVTLLGEADNGEFSGQTRFLDMDEISQEALVKRLRFELVDDVTAFILMSDGVSDPKFETEARLARSTEWDVLWRDINSAVAIAHDNESDEKAKKLLSWLDFWSQGNHDDRTIAIIY